MLISNTEPLIEMRSDEMIMGIAYENGKFIIKVAVPTKINSYNCMNIAMSKDRLTQFKNLIETALNMVDKENME